MRASIELELLRDIFWQPLNLSRVVAVSNVSHRNGSLMQTHTDTHSELSRTLAAEDVRRGDYVSLLHEIVELPSYYWSCDAWTHPPEELVRLRWRTADCGLPLKVKAVCLPFVFVKKPCGEHRTLDVRHHALVRLTRTYGRAVWKALSKKDPDRQNGLAAALV